MANLVQSQNFERVQVLFNQSIQFNSSLVGSVTTSGDQGVSPVPGMSGNHATPGWTRGNAIYTASIKIFQTTNTEPIDFTNIDYDNTPISIALYCPSQQYGTNDVFSKSIKQYLLTGVFLATNDELEAMGVGQAVTSAYVFKAINAQWITTVTNG